MVTTNHKLDYLKRKGSNTAEEQLEHQEERARDKWEKLTWFMLNIDNIQNKNKAQGHNSFNIINQSIIDMLKESKFIEENKSPDGQQPGVGTFGSAGGRQTSQ